MWNDLAGIALHCGRLKTELRRDLGNLDANGLGPPHER